MIFACVLYDVALQMGSEETKRLTEPDGEEEEEEKKGPVGLMNSERP